MAALTVHANPNTKSRPSIPYLLDIQSDLLSSLGTRVVVPLYRQETTTIHPISRLTPVVEFKGQAYVAMVPELAGVAQRELGESAGSLLPARAEILAALDLLFTGF